MFVSKIFELHNNPVAFKELMRDFLVQLKTFSGATDNAELYSEERALEQQQQVQNCLHVLVLFAHAW